MEWDAEEGPVAPVPASVDEALAALTALGNPDRAASLRRKLKIEREVLGCALPALSDLAGAWRAAMGLDARLELAQALWQSGGFEARIMAAKLLTQARIRPDDAAVWQMLCGFLAETDHAVIADHSLRAAERRLMADFTRLSEISGWLEAASPWLRQAALLITLPLVRLPHPKPAEQAALAEVLLWAEHLAEDPSRIVQQALAQWLREMSRRDPEATRAFLLAHGLKLPVFARFEAAQLLAEPVIYPEPQAEEDGIGEGEECHDPDEDLGSGDGAHRP